MDFLNEDDVCGQQLLRLVSRGNSILAELYRLSDHVPRFSNAECFVSNSECLLR